MTAKNETVDKPEEEEPDAGGIFAFMSGGACCACGRGVEDVSNDEVQVEPPVVVAAAEAEEPEDEFWSAEPKSPTKRKWLKIPRQRQTSAGKKLEKGRNFF